MKPILIAIGVIIAIAALITSINRWTEQMHQRAEPVCNGGSGGVGCGRTGRLRFGVVMH